MTEAYQRILVVDDETPIRRYLRAALTAQGFTVYEASNGEEALNAVLANRPDMPLLDFLDNDRVIAGHNSPPTKVRDTITRFWLAVFSPCRLTSADHA